MVRPIQLPHDLELRLVRADDATRLADAYTRNREYLAPWEPLRPDAFFEPEWHDDEVRLQLGSAAEGRSLPLVITDGDRIVGRLNLSNIVRGASQSASLGYWVDRHYAGRGVGTAAVLAAIDLARDELTLHRLEAGTLVHNHRSQRVLVNAGFEPIGLAPRYLRIAGQWQDHRLFQRLLDD
ncbi:GNAT family N-acetyltransferase [Agromyces ramosus]|uniref:GNAT family N-acetyltransferase n=1 Tax=Agromyces ramosus TaxID=33879 RepID=UPI0027D7F3ED|nr:GNAT family N-acetyltransferase [Agromyces ramosus]